MTGAKLQPQTSPQVPQTLPDAEKQEVVRGWQRRFSFPVIFDGEPNIRISPADQNSDVFWLGALYYIAQQFPHQVEEEYLNLIL
jgi:hypothetical protein